MTVKREWKRAAARKHYLKYRERYLQKQREYRLANNEVIKEKDKIYRKKNRKRITEGQRAWKEKNKEECQKKQHAYYLKNQEKIKRQSKEWRMKNQMKSRKFRLRFEVLARDNFTCQYCGLTPKDGARLEIDHIMPRSKGGKNTKNNLITSCRKCNLGKGDVFFKQKESE